MSAEPEPGCAECRGGPIVGRYCVKHHARVEALLDADDAKTASSCSECDAPDVNDGQDMNPAKHFVHKHDTICPRCGKTWSVHYERHEIGFHCSADEPPVTSPESLARNLAAETTVLFAATALLALQKAAQEAWTLVPKETRVLLRCLIRAYDAAAHAVEANSPASDTHAIPWGPATEAVGGASFGVRCPRCRAPKGLEACMLSPCPCTCHLIEAYARGRRDEHEAVTGEKLYSADDDLGPSRLDALARECPFCRAQPGVECRGGVLHGSRFRSSDEPRMPDGQPASFICVKCGQAIGTAHAAPGGWHCYECVSRSNELRSARLAEIQAEILHTYGETFQRLAAEQRSNEAKSCAAVWTGVLYGEEKPPPPCDRPAGHDGRHSSKLPNHSWEWEGQRTDKAQAAPRKAAVSLIQREDGRVLCVWNLRYQGFSLPGGMVEDGETIDGALRRELREETSLEVVSAERIFEGAHNLRPKSGDRGGRASVVVALFRVVASGEPREVEPGCRIEWLAWEEFLGQSPFGAFYREILPTLAVPCSETAPIVTIDILRRWLRELEVSLAAPDMRGVEVVCFELRKLFEKTSGDDALVRAPDAVARGGGPITDAGSGPEEAGTHAPLGPKLEGRAGAFHEMETVSYLVRRAALLMRASKRGEVQAHVKDDKGWIELTLPEHRPAPQGPEPCASCGGLRDFNLNGYRQAVCFACNQARERQIRNETLAEVVNFIESDGEHWEAAASSASDARRGLSMLANRVRCMAVPEKNAAARQDGAIEFPLPDTRAVVHEIMREEALAAIRERDALDALREEVARLRQTPEPEQRLWEQRSEELRAKLNLPWDAPMVQVIAVIDNLQKLADLATQQVLRSGSARRSVVIVNDPRFAGMRGEEIRRGRVRIVVTVNPDDVVPDEKGRDGR